MTQLAVFVLLLATWMLPGGAIAQSPLPQPDHIVIVIEENHAFDQIVDSPAAPYLNDLIKRGALLTQSYGATHPSQPNYIALFGGFIEGIVKNTCPHQLSTPNLRSSLAAVGKTFTGYAEDLPSVGAADCVAGGYVRKHNPWVNWQGAPTYQVPAEENRPFADFPTDFSQLPTVSIVIPNQANDMHDGWDPGRIKRGDEWLRFYLDRYVEWAATHNSLLIVTFDEDNGKSDNRIPTILVGPMVKQGRFDERTDHYGLLRTLTDLYGAEPVGLGAKARPLTSIWAEPRR